MPQDDTQCFHPADPRLMEGMTDEARLGTQLADKVPREGWLRNLETINILRDSRGLAEVEDGCPTVFSGARSEDRSCM